MNLPGGGFIPIINYTGSGGAIAASFSLLTESSADLLTDTSSDIDY